MAGTPGPPANAPSYTAAQVTAAITAAANQYGVPPAVLIAAANVESGGNPNEAGGGLFQDIVGGEASNAAFGGNPENVYNLQDSVNNAAQTFAAAAKANPGKSWGEIAAAAQRPANRTAYANAINSSIGQPLGGSTNATLDASMTTAPAASSSTTALVPETVFSPAVAGSNAKNFHGYDLSAIPKNELGNAERDIEKYITDPGYAQQLQQRVAQDYGYQGSWAEKVPQLNAVLVWAASNLDLSTAAGKNQFQSAVAGTQWWKTTNANQRSWQQVQATDPAQAHQALLDAQDKVLATANQIGVTLTKKQLDGIANTYASQSFVQSGSLGSQSGTSQEWLDQAVTSAVTAVQKGQTLSPLEAAPQSDQFGIASQLLQQFKTVAQQYLMYSSSPSSPLTDQNLEKYVNGALANYTGSGSAGSSNLINGAVQSFTTLMQIQASQLYPSMKQAIETGTTPQAYAQPIQNLIANKLGINAASVDLTSPTYNFAIAAPPGQTTAPTQDQILQKITNPNFTFQANGQTLKYDNTNDAMQNAKALTSSLANTFGVGGG